MTESYIESSVAPKQEAGTEQTALKDAVAHPATQQKDPSKMTKMERLEYLEKQLENRRAASRKAKAKAAQELKAKGLHQIRLSFPQDCFRDVPTMTGKTYKTARPEVRLCGAVVFRTQSGEIVKVLDGATGKVIYQFRVSDAIKQ